MTKPFPREKVYRVENEYKRGAYYVWRHSEETLPCDPTIHPTMSSDTGFQKLGTNTWYEATTKFGFSRDGARFAFASIEQFLAWFYSSKARKELADYGYHLSVYDVFATGVVKGDKQVIFDVKKAKLVDKLDLIELDKADAFVSK